MQRLKIQSSKSRALANARRDAMRHMLLGYALRLGATELKTQRLLAARLWRLLPQGISLRSAILRLDYHVALWASAALERSVTVSQLATAIIDAKLLPDFILLPTAAIAPDVLARLKSGLIPVAPPETPTVMPVQSLAPFYAPRSKVALTSATSI